MFTREEMLAQWQRQEANVRANLGVSGVVNIEELKQYSGLKFLQAMRDGELPVPPMAQTLGFTLIEIAKGHAVFQGTPGIEHYNPIGSVHGGYFCTLLDSALACAIQSTLPQGTGYTTLELKVNLLRALCTKTGPIRAIGKIIKVGTQIGVAEADILDVDGKIYVHATTTCLISPLP